MSFAAVKILLVEDNADDEALTLRALRHHKMADNVVVAHDGVEALDFLLSKEAKLSPLPHFVMLDLNLPRVNGHEVLKTLRANARTCHLPVVVLSSSIEESDIQSCYLSGANSYIRKPVDYRQFVDSVEKIGEYWLNLNQRPTC